MYRKQFSILAVLFAFQFQALGQEIISVVVVDVDAATMWIEAEEDLPNSGDPTGWTATVYDLSQDDGKGDGDPVVGAANWQAGQHGVGYGDGDDNTLVDDDNNIRGIYTRTEFMIDDASKVVGMRFEVDYDDGYILWINGVEISRSPNAEGGDATWDLLVANHGSSESGVLDPPIALVAFISALIDGVNVMAVSNRNTSPGSSDMTMIPRLTVDIDISAPEVTSISRTGAIDEPFITGTAEWEVVFEEEVVNVSDDDFSITVTGDATGDDPTVALAKITGTTFLVTSANVTGEVGTMRLKFNDGTDVVTVSDGTSIAGKSGETYMIGIALPSAGFIALLAGMAALLLGGAYALYRRSDRVA